MNERMALKIIQPIFNDQNGWLSLKDATYEPTRLEWEAVDYLCDEWDYAFIRQPISQEELDGRY